MLTMYGFLIPFLVKIMTFLKCMILKFIVLQEFIIINHQTSGIKEPIEDFASPIQLSLRDAPSPSVTIATYGYMADLCRQAALRLAYEEEIFIDIVIFSQLLPMDISPINRSLQKTGHLLVVEEGTITSGWGAEILASSLEEFGNHHFQAMRVASKDSPIPAAHILEQVLLPGIEDIILAVKKMV